MKAHHFITDTKVVNVLAFNKGIPFCADGNASHGLFWCILKPAMDSNPDLALVIDMTGVENMTDSFANTLFGPLGELRAAGRDVAFKGCSELVKSFILSAIEMQARRTAKNKS